MSEQQRPLTLEAWVTPDLNVSWCMWVPGTDEGMINKLKAIALPVTPATARDFADALRKAADDADLYASVNGTQA